MRIFKAAVGVALSLAFIGCLNVALTFVLEPFGSKSELVWTDYAEQQEMDTVMVGTSLMQFAIDPYALDEACGTESFCLATPSQTLEESLIGIQTAYEDHAVKRAVLGMSLSSLEASEPPSAGDAFLHHRSRFVTPGQAADAAWQVLVRYGGIRQADSLNLWFPWLYNHVSIRPSVIADNVKSRLSRSVYEAAEIVDTQWSYVGKGYGASKKTVDCNSDDVVPMFAGERADDGSPLVSIDEDRKRTLGDICAYCADNGIELIVVSVPMPVFDVVDGDGYYELHDAMQEVLSEHGQKLYDFNYARPELFENDDAYYFDTQHLNGKGSQAFTASFASFLNKLEAAEDVDGLFYSADEQRASVERISAVFADTSVDADGIHIEARAACGTGLDVEYALRVRDEEAGKWKTVSKWSGDSAFDYRPEGRGVIELRVQARLADGKDEQKHYRNIHAYF